MLVVPLYSSRTAYKIASCSYQIVLNKRLKDVHGSSWINPGPTDIKRKKFQFYSTQLLFHPAFSTKSFPQCFISYCICILFTILPAHITWVLWVQGSGFLLQMHSCLTLGHLSSLLKLLILARYSTRKKKKKRNTQNAGVWSLIYTWKSCLQKLAAPDNL